MLSVLKRHNYNSIIEDLYDICVPIHNDLAFDHGIRFRAKFIGSLIIPRPTSRIEIVSAMRKVRKEFKLNCVEKRKVDIEINAAGITVSMVKRKRKSLFSWQENQVPTMFHPIY
uniref:Uncharacterized protein n=1 Tax=Romanomermis culicivorax TaxID=13658 RepID=A0A915ISX9_ROMCU